MQILEKFRRRKCLCRKQPCCTDGDIIPLGSAGKDRRFFADLGDNLFQRGAALQKLPDKGVCVLADAVGEHENDIVRPEGDVPDLQLALRFCAEGEGLGADAGHLAVVANQRGSCAGLHDGECAGIQIELRHI